MDLAKIIRDSTDLPVIVQPHRGRPTLEGGAVIYKQSAEEFIDDMHTIVGLGMNVVGCCCGTDPEFISGLKVAFRDRFPAAARAGARP
jgi:5-methyltetrahydrofolate--homocysteine methyltransferase